MIYVDILDTTYQEVITTYVLDTMLHHVVMLLILENHEDIKYDMDIQNSDWLTGGPWYNTSICKKSQEKMFEGFILNARTDRYNIMRFIDEYEKEHQSSRCDDGSRGGGCPLPTTATIE